jgi:hypothetical protein
VLNISAQTACGFKVSTELLNPPAAGGQQTFRVNTTNGCQWRAVNAVPWMTLNRRSGNGTGSVYFTVQPNPGMPRKASITVADQEVTITQPGLPSISGRVTYENAPVPPVPVSSTAISATGTPAVMAMSGTDGNYILMGLGPGPYTVTPSKLTQPFTTANGIFSNDAALISRHVVGLITLNATQQKAAAVGGQANISSFDAGLIAQYIVGIPNMANLTGQWKFTPVDRSYAAVNASQSDQDFAALLMGDVSGDWTPPTLRPLESSTRPMPWEAALVSLPGTKASPGETVTLPLRIVNTGGEAVSSYQFTLRYDPAVVRPAEIAASLEGTMSESMSLTWYSPIPGVLNIVVYSAFPVTGDGTYLNLMLTAAGEPGSSTPIIVSGFRLNDGSKPVISSRAAIEIR